MNETTTHTPLRLGLYPSDVFDARGNIYASTYGNKERAAHIVKCVNAHDALVQRLQELVNICTHPNAKKSDMRMIAAEARSFLFDLDADKPAHA